MGKYKYLIKNVVLLMVSNFGSKILSFILVPLYTSVLTTAEYGTYDLFSNTISLLVPILTLSINDAVMRFTLDKDSDDKSIFSIGMKYFFKSSFIVVLFVFLNNILSINEGLKIYAGPFIILFMCNSLLGIITSFARGLEKVKDISISSFLSTVVLLLSNIIFLLILKIGLVGYFYSNILGILVQVIYLFFRLKCWRYYRFRQNNVELNKAMIAYSAPLIANNVAWWINNVSDRYVVTFICGASINGIYSVATKIPTILNVFQSIFNQAWTLSAVRDFQNNEDGFISKMYAIYNFGIVCVCSVLIMLDRILSSILYEKDFYMAWRFVPFLLIASVFGSMSGYIGGIFTATKDSKIFAKTTAIGAIINIVLNLIFVPYVGAMGAAVATMISYAIVWGIRLRELMKKTGLKIELKLDVIAYVILLIQAVVINCINTNWIMYLIQVVLCVAILGIYRKLINEIFVRCKSIITSRIKK